jgi:hypothetical protein
VTKLWLLVQINSLIKLYRWFKFNQIINSNLNNIWIEKKIQNFTIHNSKLDQLAKSGTWPACAQHTRPTRPRPAWAGKMVRAEFSSPHIVSRPSSSNGHQRPLSFSLALFNPRRNERATKAASRRVTQREERKRARDAVLSPSPACTPTVGWTRRHRAASQQHLSARALTDEMASAGSIVVSMSCVHPQAVHRWDLEPNHAPASGGSGSTRSMRRSAADGGSWGENK